jgi:hypothetical protein
MEGRALSSRMINCSGLKSFGETGKKKDQIEKVRLFDTSAS